MVRRRGARRPLVQGGGERLHGQSDQGGGSPPGGDSLRAEVLEWLSCPVCGGEFTFTGFEVAGEGLLSCAGCGRRYPVLLGIPRILPDDLLGGVYRRHPDFAARHAREIPSAASFLAAPAARRDLQARTMESFGYQWTRYGEMVAQWRTTFDRYFEPFRGEDFRGRAVADLGCGYGRWAYFLAERGARLVALDLSLAVEVAGKVLEPFPSAQVVQADLLHPPLRPRFDMVYSIGVLHHLPRGAAGGVRAAAKLARPGGTLFVWLYGAHRGDERPGPFARLRRLTSRLPHPLLARLVVAGAILVRICFLAPGRLLGAVGLDRWGERLPFRVYRGWPLRQIAAELFDMLATPREHGYSSDEVLDLLRGAGVPDPRVSALGYPRRPEASWRGWGTVGGEGGGRSR